MMAAYTECPPDKIKLQALSGEDEASAARYKTEVLAKHKSVLDLLEEFRACELPFPVYLEMLPALRPRYYSISSSPLQHSDAASITVAVVDAPARSGKGQYKGVCSNYLLEQAVGSEVYAFVRDTGSAFRLPSDTTLPLIMVGPGTGLAPFRGFLQERAAQKSQGQSVGPALLFFGCRTPEQDFIYADELQAWDGQELAKLQVAFSRLATQPKTYVQDLISQSKDEVWQLLEQGAVVYICGDASHMAPAVRQTFLNIYQDKTGTDAEAATVWLNHLTGQQRYLVDVWGAS
jgi:cytochrome P450/NADPH-cytochrome P450 reductase